MALRVETSIQSFFSGSDYFMLVKGSHLKTIPFCEPWFEASYADTVRNQVLSGWVGPGPTTSKFESEIARYVKSSHCLLTTSGTVALMVAAKALELKAGDEIIVPAYGVISTINAFTCLELKPVLADIEKSTGCISPKDLAVQICRKTKAVCYVNFSGYTGRNLLEIVEICKEKKVPLIEDSACALGQCYQNRFAGTFGDVGTYSFSVPKIITTGQGGALVTNSDEYYERAACFIDQGDTNWRKTNLIRRVGTNFRFNDILASFGIVQLKEIQARIERKRRVYKVLRSRLGEKIFHLPEESVPLHHIVFAVEKEQLIKFLRERGIEATCQYRTLSEHPVYHHLGDGKFPQADFWTQYAVYLPFGLALEEEAAGQIAQAVLGSGVKLLDVGTNF